MNDYFYNLAQKNGWGKNFLQQLKSTNNNLANSYNSQRSALNTQYDNSLKQYDVQKQQANATALKSGREAYKNYMQTMNPFNNVQSSLARSGLSNSGYAESMGIRANNDYLTNVGNAETTRDLALANIDSEISALRNERDNKLASLQLDEEKDLYNNYNKIMQLYENQRQRELAEAQAKASASSSSSLGGSGGGYSTYSYSRPTNATQSKTTATKSKSKTTGKSSGGGGGGSFGSGGSMGGRGLKENSSQKLGYSYSTKNYTKSKKYNSKKSTTNRVLKSLKNLFK